MQLVHQRDDFYPRKDTISTQLKNNIQEGAKSDYSPMCIPKLPAELVFVLNSWPCTSTAATGNGGDCRESIEPNGSFYISIIDNDVVPLY